jgi:hypothetical protein
MGLTVGFCCSFGFLLSGLGFCCSFSVGHPILLLLLLLDQHRRLGRLGLLGRPILWVSQMGLTVMASTAGNVHRLASTAVMASTPRQCSSPGSAVIAGGEVREREREEERRERQRCQEREEKDFFF